MSTQVAGPLALTGVLAILLLPAERSRIVALLVGRGALVLAALGSRR